MSSCWTAGVGPGGALPGYRCTPADLAAEDPRPTVICLLLRDMPIFVTSTNHPRRAVAYLVKHESGMGCATVAKFMKCDLEHRYSARECAKIAARLRGVLRLDGEWTPAEADVRLVQPYVDFVFESNRP